VRAKRTVLVGGLLLATVLGVAGGYATGMLTSPSSVTVSGVPAPLGRVTGSPSPSPLPVKTPKPNGYKPLGEVDFHWQTFTVDLEQNDAGVDPPPIRMSVRVPIGWEMTTTEKGEAKFTDPKHVRWVRVSPVYPVKLSAKQKRDQLVPMLKSTIAHEDLFKLIGQADDAPTGMDGRTRRVSTLTYSYIPDEWLRPVIVEYVTTADSAGADFEMSVTALPDDQAAMERIAEVAANSIKPA
jgi:hypothetical protein